VIADPRVALPSSPACPSGDGRPLDAAGHARRRAPAAAMTLLAGGLLARLVALGIAALGDRRERREPVHGVRLTVAGALFRRRVLGGATGDGHGAVNKVVELGTYAALAAAWA
jgi:cobalamin synthase